MTDCGTCGGDGQQRYGWECDDCGGSVVCPHTATVLERAGEGLLEVCADCSTPLEYHCIECERLVDVTEPRCPHCLQVCLPEQFFGRRGSQAASRRAPSPGDPI